MKRSLLVLFAGLLLNAHVFAQYDDYYDDYDDYDYGSGTASGASGPSVVTNDGTEGYSEQRLTLPNNQPIYLYFYNTVQNPAASEPQASSSPPPATPAKPTPPLSPPEPLIEYRYVSPPASTPTPVPEPVYLPSPPKVEYIYLQPPAPKVEYVYIQPPEPQVEYVYLPPPEPQVEYVYLPPPEPQIEYVYLPAPQVDPVPPPPAPEPVYIPSNTQIRVIPGLPNPNSRKTYRLQVGSYTAQNTAEKTAQRIRSAGLQASVENYNSLKRVIVPAVRAADACQIVQMLEMLGFKEVWIRE